MLASPPTPPQHHAMPCADIVLPQPPPQTKVTPIHTKAAEHPLPSVCVPVHVHARGAALSMDANALCGPLQWSCMPAPGPHYLSVPHSMRVTPLSDARTTCPCPLPETTNCHRKLVPYTRLPSQEGWTHKQTPTHVLCSRRKRQVGLPPAHHHPKVGTLPQGVQYVLCLDCRLGCGARARACVGRWR